jgi:hypothetical protein
MERYGSKSYYYGKLEHERQNHTKVINRNPDKYERNFDKVRESKKPCHMYSACCRISISRLMGSLITETVKIVKVDQTVSEGLILSLLNYSLRFLVKFNLRLQHCYFEWLYVDHTPASEGVSIINYGSVWIINWVRRPTPRVIAFLQSGLRRGHAKARRACWDQWAQRQQGFFGFSSFYFRLWIYNFTFAPRK